MVDVFLRYLADEARRLLGVAFRDTDWEIFHIGDIRFPKGGGIRYPFSKGRKKIEKRKEKGKGEEEKEEEEGEEDMHIGKRNESNAVQYFIGCINRFS